MQYQTTLAVPRIRNLNLKALGRPITCLILRPLELAANGLFYAAGIGFLLDFLLRIVPSPTIESAWPMVLLREATIPVMAYCQATLSHLRFLPNDIYKAVPLALSLAAWLIQPVVKRKLQRAQDIVAGTSAEAIFGPRPVENAGQTYGSSSSSAYELVLGDDFSSARLIVDDEPGSTSSPIVTNANQTLRTIGRFELIQELGRGPAGAVYKALDLQLGRTVALKVLLPNGHSKDEIHEFRERLCREGRTAAKLIHPGIVAVYDTAEDTLGNPYIVMEYVDGESLSEALHERASEEPMSLAQRMELAIQISKTLDYAHRTGVIHRDLKPSNVLLTGEGNAKIADFGIAMHLQGDSLDGTVPGTPAFVAPELLQGSPAKAASDIFSLGVLMYWMFTGEIPFTGNSVTEIVHQVTYADPAPARRLNWALPQDLDRVLRQCMAKKPSDRYATAGEVAADLIAMREGRFENVRMSA